MYCTRRQVDHIKNRATPPRQGSIDGGLFWPIPKQKNQNGRPKKARPLILNIFSQKFHGLVFSLVGLIDAKDIDVAQPIWL